MTHHLRYCYYDDRGLWCTGYMPEDQRPAWWDDEAEEAPHRVYSGPAAYADARTFGGANNGTFRMVKDDAGNTNFEPVGKAEAEAAPARPPHRAAGDGDGPYRVVTDPFTGRDIYIPRDE